MQKQQEHKLDRHRHEVYYSHLPPPFQKLPVREGPVSPALTKVILGQNEDAPIKRTTCAAH